MVTKTSTAVLILLFVVGMLGMMVVLFTLNEYSTTTPGSSITTIVSPEQITQYGNTFCVHVISRGKKELLSFKSAIKGEYILDVELHDTHTKTKEQQQE